MKTITFYSYKGGVGRSLALSNVANRLSEFGKKVCIIDFDLEAPGMHLKFDVNIGKQGVKNGLVDYIYEFSKFKKVPGNIEDYVTYIKFKDDAKRKDIALIAAGNTLSKEYWKKLSAINWNDMFYNNNSLGVDFFYNLKEQIRTQVNPDFLLIDSRTGITDISGVTMSIFADEVVLMAANNKENIEGISQVMKTLVIPANSILNQVPKINFVLCRVPYFTKAKDKPKEAVAKKAAMKFINDSLLEANVEGCKLEKIMVIHSDPELEMQENFKIGYEHDRGKDASVTPIGLDYLELFEEITRDVLSESDKTEFNDFLKSESLIEKAIANFNYAEKIKNLNAAIKLNPKSSNAYFAMATVNYDLGENLLSMASIDKAIELSAHTDTRYYNFKAAICLELMQLDEALNIYQETLALEPKNLFTLYGLANTYHTKGEFEKALSYQKMAISVEPELDWLWNSYGNTLRVMGRFEDAIDAVYKALEIDPQSSMATLTLGEIYAELGNLREFYKNLELAFSFGMDSNTFQGIIGAEKVYVQFKNDDKFQLILIKYEIDVDLSVLHSKF